jgi:hypothetical protein
MPCSLLTSGNLFDQRATEKGCFLKKNKKKEKRLLTQKMQEEIL